MIKVKIINYLIKALKDADLTQNYVEVEVFVPDNEKFGHYSTNIALKLAKLRKQNPMIVAEKIKSVLLRVVVKDLFEKIEIAPPGFINFWLSEKALQNEIKEILKKSAKYGAGSKKKEKISLDYLDANPTGPIHLGHARSGFLGDTLANILEFSGYKASKEFYVNNAKNSVQIQSLGKTALGKGEEYKHKQLLSIIKKPEVKKKLKNLKEAKAGVYIAGIIQKENEKFLKEQANIKFDVFFEEEKIYSSGLVEKIIKKLKDNKATYKKDGALWLKASRFGDNEDRVLIRSNGEPTYLVPDIGYHWDRLIKRKYNKVINIWGADHFGYGPRLKAAISALGIDASKISIIIAQTVRLMKGGEEFKMSKRKGIFTTLEDLIQEVGLDAARFFFLMYSPDTHMDFDLDLAKERSLKNPVYYAQYAAVRCGSVLRKGRRGGGKVNFGLLSTSEDINLMRILVRFPEIIEKAAQNYSPQILVRYSLDLARQFHNFYEKERIIGLDDKNLVSARLSLIQATLLILENIFNLLGIALPKKM